MEQEFLLMYYLGFTWDSFPKLPVSYRRWFIKRLNKEMAQASENGGGARGAHNNMPDTRGLQGRVRPKVPSRLQRMT